MDKTLKELERVAALAGKVQNFFTKPQLMDGINSLSISFDRLNQQLAVMNSAVLEQNQQLGTSIERTTQQAVELRQELEKLNEVSGKSHELFKRLEKSTVVTENLNKVVTIFAAITAGAGLYPVFKDIVCTTSTVCNYTYVSILGLISAFIVFVVLWFFLSKTSRQ